MLYETPAFLKAAARKRRSCVSQRTDDLLSGSSTQASASADFFSLVANAAVTVTPTVSAAIARAMLNFFTSVSSWSNLA